MNSHERAVRVWAATAAALCVSFAFVFGCNEPPSRIPFQPATDDAAPAPTLPDRAPGPERAAAPAPPAPARPEPAPARSAAEPVPAADDAVTLLSPTPDPTAESYAIISESQSTLTGSNLGMADLICLAWRTPESPSRLVPLMSALRVVADVPLPGGRFDAGVYLPGANASRLRAALRRHLMTHFGITARRETREVDALVLVAPSGRLASPSLPSPAGAGDRKPPRREPGFLELSGDDPALLAEELERGLGRPVVDETGTRGAYRVRIPTAGEAGARLDLAATRAALREQAGLDLVAERRPVEFLIVERAAPPSE